MEFGKQNGSVEPNLRASPAPVKTERDSKLKLRYREFKGSIYAIQITLYLQEDRFGYVVYSAQDNSQLVAGEGKLNARQSLLENMTKIASVVNKETSLAVYKETGGAHAAAVCDN